MFKTLKELFTYQATSFATGDDAGDALPLAVAALLFEISRADHEIHAQEHAAMVAAVAQVCAVPTDEIEALLRSADAAVEDATSLYDFTSVINDNFSNEKKYELLLMLWRVAYADGRVDRYEEYYVRKIADLLHLSQRDFIRAKHAALL
jgi:uncharacterized tellurite resistance protein B-like protein